MGDEAILEELRGRVAASPFHAGFGLTVVDADQGSVRLGWLAREEHRNLQGLVHGGLLATLADVAMGLAVRTAIEPGRRHVTIELGVHYVRPAAPGAVSAIGRVVRVGTQIAFAEADVLDAHDRLVVRGTGTYSVTAPREPG
ncbi:MAG TPA: PaaI family thioesterase [Actinomycetota bacterium]|nr:PaaI family thioesterase [Actinomycetota bacterium]